MCTVCPLSTRNMDRDISIFRLQIRDHKAYCLMTGLVEITYGRHRSLLFISYHIILVNPFSLDRVIFGGETLKEYFDTLSNQPRKLIPWNTP